MGKTKSLTNTKSSNPSIDNSNRDPAQDQCQVDPLLSVTYTSDLPTTSSSSIPPSPSAVSFSSSCTQASSGHTPTLNSSANEMDCNHPQANHLSLVSDKTAYASLTADNLLVTHGPDSTTSNSTVRVPECIPNGSFSSITSSVQARISSDSFQPRSSRKRKSTPDSDQADSEYLVSPAPSYPSETCGLKIRLRRDWTPSDTCKGHGRKGNRKSIPTFRIVESSCDTDAPGNEYLRHSAAILPPLAHSAGSIRVGNIVWAKIAGYPYWPSRVDAIWARTVHQLSQATLLPAVSSGQTMNSSSLSVLQTPPDPSLAAGYTARVGWLAWDQYSFLSCAKLFPFKEFFEKLYSPRTRVKGYTEAVRLAKRLSDGCHDPPELEVPNSGSSPTVGSFNASAPPSNDSQWSVMLPCASSERPASASIHPILPQDPSDIDEPHDLGNKDSRLNLDFTPDINLESLDLPVSDSLPNLDVEGLTEFTSHVPTFSEDEDDIAQCYPTMSI